MSEGRLRIDKWLWYARFFKSRSMAARLCAAGRIRVGGLVVHKAHHVVKEGDVLTFPQGRDIRVVRVAALGTRRGPPAEARTLYDDLDPPARPQAATSQPAARDPGSGRPTKADRRAIERIKPIQD